MSAFHLPSLRFIFLPLSFCLLLCLAKKRETERERQKDDRAKSRNGIGKSADSANQGDILKTVTRTRLPFSDVVNAQPLSSLLMHTVHPVIQNGFLTTASGSQLPS